MEMAKKKLALEHVVVSGGGSKGASAGGGLSAAELDSVLKFGAKELFNDDQDADAEGEGEGEAEGEGKGGAEGEANNGVASETAGDATGKPQATGGGADEKAEATENAARARRWGDGASGRQIVWDEEAVDKLVDRDAKPEPAADEPSCGTDGAGTGGEESKGGSKVATLLQSFAVATFSRTMDEEEAEAKAEEEALALAAEAEKAAAKEAERAASEAAEAQDRANQALSWEAILGSAAAKEAEVELAALGKGKRERRQARLFNIGGHARDGSLRVDGRRSE